MTTGSVRVEASRLRDDSVVLVASRSDWRPVTAVLVTLDALALAVAFGLAFLIRFEAGLPLEVVPHSLAFYSTLAFWAVPLWLGVFAIYRLFDPRVIAAGFQQYARIINACTIGTIVVIVLSFLDVSFVISRGWLLLTWALSIALVCTERFAFRRLIRLGRRKGRLIVPTIIVGANEEGRAIAEQLASDPGSGTRVLGFVDDSCPPNADILPGIPALGGQERLSDLVERFGVSEVVIATTALSREALLDVYRILAQSPGLRIRLSSGLFEILTTGISIEETASVPLMTPQRVRITGVDAVLKALLDRCAALAGLLALSPLFLALAIAVRLDSPGPVFHRRRVLGREGRAFDAYKFRTMVVDADAVLARDAALSQAFSSGYKLQVDSRVTRLGRVLRRTSLDELPQLLNVLKGEMSLVGPRMIAPDEAARYGKWRINLLTVKPGITGPWQVRGRSDIPYDERVRLSMQYIRNYSIWLDLEILLRTVPAVLSGRGAY